MASTVNQVLSKFRRSFRQIDEPRAKQLFDDAHREILAKCRLRETTIQISLVSGTRAYDISETAIKVLAAEYRFTSTSWRSLMETSVDDLDMNHTGWRSTTVTGTPSRYYLAGANTGNTAKLQIGFDPVPDTTTATGYPIVDVHCIREAVLSLTDTVPPQLDSDDIYVSTMGEKACREIEALRPQWEFWNGRAEEDLGKSILWVKNREDRLNTRFVLGTRNNRMV